MDGWKEYDTCSRCVYSSYTAISKNQALHNVENGYCSFCHQIEGSAGLKYAQNPDGTYMVTGIGICTDTDIVIGIYNNRSVTSIRSSAFEDCNSLTSVTIGDGVTSIGSSAFYSCTSLTSVVIPDNVTYIGYRAFYECFGLTSVVIGNSVTSIISGAFYSCYRLVEVVNKSTHITITKGVAMNDYTGAYALVVYNSNSGITESQLRNDNGYIIYTNGNEKILVGYNGMETDLVLPSYITKINRYAFYRCKSLTSMVIPDSVTSIGANSFDYCDSLRNIYYKGTAEEWSNISFPPYFSISNGTCYYYSETKPTSSGKYWHYDENGDIAIW